MLQVQVPVAGAHVPLPEQLFVVAGVQVPVMQVSPVVHASMSLHVVPGVLGGSEHTPVIVLQVPTSWHWLLAVQTTGAVPVQVPVMHTSVAVHRLPSLQPVPSDAFAYEHTPVAGAHTPACLQGAAAGQVSAVPAVQTPAWQVSVVVHMLPSSQPLPFMALA
jgi:hypothetical protein